MSKYQTREELEDKAEWEGGPLEFIFGYGLSPDELPEGTPAHVIEAVTRLTTQGSADLETFENWLHAPEGSPDA
jgi:hypothetical protein